PGVSGPSRWRGWRRRGSPSRPGAEPRRALPGRQRAIRTLYIRAQADVSATLRRDALPMTATRSAAAVLDPTAVREAAEVQATAERDRRAGAPELVRSLYKEHGLMLLGYCTRQLGGDRQTAEEVVQET